MAGRKIKVAMPDGTWLNATLPEPGVVEPSPTTRPPKNKGKPRNTGAAGYKRRAAKRHNVRRYA